MITPTGEDGHSPSRIDVSDEKVERVIDYNAIRQNAMITNNSSTICYIGLTEGVSPTNGFPLNQNDVCHIDKDNPYTGPVFAITASGTADLRIMEVSRPKKGDS